MLYKDLRNTYKLNFASLVSTRATQAIPGRGETGCLLAGWGGSRPAMVGLAGCWAGSAGTALGRRGRVAEPVDSADRVLLSSTLSCGDVRPERLFSDCFSESVLLLRDGFSSRTGRVRASCTLGSRRCSLMPFSLGCSSSLTCLQTPQSKRESLVPLPC